MYDGAPEQPSLPELIAVSLSRELKDWEVGSPGGARSEIPMAAARLAQLLHAPNLVVLTSASGYVANARDKPPSVLLPSTTDFRNIYSGAEGVLPFRTAFNIRRDWFFAGGIQVDMFGNLNMIAVGDERSPKMRGPGVAGQDLAATHARRYYIYLLKHDIRTFVRNVDHVGTVGFGNGGEDRARLRLPGGGPVLVISPLALFDFEPDSKRMRLKSLHPGITLDEVMGNTGFELIVPPGISTTSTPTELELSTLRNLVDRNGVLRTAPSRPFENLSVYRTMPTVNI